MKIGKMAKHRRDKRDQVAMRRTPQQERSRDRLDAIQAEAERLILERGLTGYSVRDVLRNTQTNIATFYQYFPNRKSLVRAIVEKYTSELSQLVAEAFEKADPSDIHRSLQHVQHAVAQFYLTHPITLKLWPGIHADNTLGALDDADTDSNVAVLEQFIAAANPAARRAEVRSAARITVITTATVVRQAAKLGPQPRNRLLRQHLEMVVGLIESLQ